ncbi:MAG: helix-turn-helix domain-containing protein [Terriglobales bacterium]
MPDAYTKMRLAAAINDLIRTKGITQTQAAEQLGINQPKISALMNYRLTGFSVERLMHFLNALGQDVEIVIRKRPARAKAGRISVRAA